MGIVPHTGWAWLARVGGAPARIQARERVIACEVLDGELYHLAAEQTRERDRFLAERRRAAVAQTIAAVSPHLGGAHAAVVLGKRFAITDTDRIVAAHPIVHAAEGELWRAVFAEACEAAGLRVTRTVAEDVRDGLAARYGGRAVAAFLAESKQIVGAPWSREPQDAALAAWSVLRG